MYSKMLKKIRADRRAFLLSRRVYDDNAAELIAFFRSRCPKSEMSIRLDGRGVDETIALDRAQERARSMARAADRSGKFSHWTVIDLEDTAVDFLAKSESEM